jgi:hypothetical protein
MKTAAKLAAFAGAWLLCTFGCTKQEARDVTDAALSVAQLVCVETSDLVDEEALSTACKIANTPLLRSILHALVGQRVAARRAGYAWPQAVDAGVGDAAK